MKTYLHLDFAAISLYAVKSTGNKRDGQIRLH